MGRGGGRFDSLSPPREAITVGIRTNGDSSRSGRQTRLPPGQQLPCSTHVSEPRRVGGGYRRHKHFGVPPHVACHSGTKAAAVGAHAQDYSLEK